PTAMGAPNDAVALRKDGRVPSSPGVSCAHSTVARCACSFTPTVATVRRPGEVAHGITSSAALRKPMPRGHTRTLMTVPHLCRPRRHCFQRRNSFFVCICLLAQLLSAHRVVLSNPTTFAASCFIGRGCGSLSLFAVNRLGEWAVPFLGHFHSTLDVLDPHSSIVFHCPEDPRD
ncbi:hypothetical protein TcCL_ESM07405, partial [Trypanosoma cruzi]